MSDPMAEIVALLRPSAGLSKVVSGRGHWAVHRSESGGPFYCVMLGGVCCLKVGDREPLILETGDFVLVPATFEFQASSLDPPANDHLLDPVRLPSGEMRHGDPNGPADVRMVVGYSTFASQDAGLLVPLLPDLIHVRGEPRFSAVVELVREEAYAGRVGREFVLSRLLEILFLEALRSVGSTSTMPNLLRGLVDERVGVALRCIHARPAEPWTIGALANESGMSRSAFFDRFHRTVGVAPMEYLMRWRMALAKDLLRTRHLAVAEVAWRVGYRSSSTFGIAFSRYFGRSPTTYVRELSATL